MYKTKLIISNISEELIVPPLLMTLKQKVEDYVPYFSVIYN